MATDGCTLVERNLADDDAVERAFRAGRAIACPWTQPATTITNALATLEQALRTAPHERSYVGLNAHHGRRESVWLAATGIGRPVHVDTDDLSRFDGPLEGGERGVALLRRDPDVARAVSIVKAEVDHTMSVVVRGLRMHEDLPGCLDELTVRYRLNRYAPAEHDSGIGLHADGCLVATVITNEPGLLLLGGPGWVERPDPGVGTVALPGSILARWTDGAVPPLIHGAPLARGQATKFSVVGFLNFQNHRDVPRSRRFTQQRAPLRNDIGAFKVNDTHIGDGDLAEFYRAHGFVTDGPEPRFKTLTELEREGSPI